MPGEPVNRICVPGNSLFHLQKDVENPHGIQYCLGINYSAGPSFLTVVKLQEVKTSNQDSSSLFVRF